MISFLKRLFGIQVVKEPYWYEYPNRYDPATWPFP
jgi:hypothetical protein